MIVPVSHWFGEARWSNQEGEEVEGKFPEWYRPPEARDP